jgi:polyphosphate kinase
MMHRNLDRRVEVLVRLSDPAHVSSIHEMFDLAMSEQTAAWQLEPSGNWLRKKLDEKGSKLSDFQDTIMQSVAHQRNK